MKKFAIIGLSFAFFASGLFGLLGMQATTVSAEEEAMPTVELGPTMVNKSSDLEYLMIATAIQNYGDVYEVGYDFGESYTVQPTDNAYSDRYFTSITTVAVGGEPQTQTAKDIFGAEYEGWGMIVWEIAYDPAEAISCTAYALEGKRNENGQLMRPTNPEDEIRHLGTAKDVAVVERTITFVDGENEDTRTVVYGQGLAESAIPAFTGTPNEGKEFYWALEDGAEADFSEIKQDVTVTKTERTIVNTVEFAFDIAANYYSDGYEYSTADQMNALSKEVECNYGEDIAFGVLVDMNYNRSIDDVKYVFHNAETGTTTELTATTQDGFVVYTLDGAKAADGYVEMVGAYAENTYEVALNLNLYDWGVLKTFDGVTVTAGGENVAIEDGKAVAMLAKGTHELVVAEPNGKETTVAVELNPTSWDECLNLSAEETVAVGYSSFTVCDATNAATDKTPYFTQDANGVIDSIDYEYDNQAQVVLKDYTIDANEDFAVKTGFTYKGGEGAAPSFCIRLDNASNYRMIFEVTKSYFRVAFGTPTSGLKSYLAQHDLGDNFKAGINASGKDYREIAEENPFEFEWMLVKTEGKLSIYHTIGSTNGEFIHFGDVTAEGIKLANGEYAHVNGTTNDITFDSTIATVLADCLKMDNLAMKFYNLGGGKIDIAYSGYGVKTSNFASAYRVEYYQQTADKSDYELVSEESLMGVTNSVVMANVKSFVGFALDDTNKNTVASGVVAEDGSLVLKLYYNRASVVYTTEYYYENVNDEGFTIAEGETASASGIHGEEASVAPADKTGFELDNTQSVLTIMLGAEGNNVLKVYYKRVRVTVTFVDGANEVMRTAKYGYGLTEAAPEFTGTPTAGYDFYWALSDGTTVDSYAGLTEDIIVSKIEKDNSSVNTVSFALENSAVVTYYNENGEALESMQNLAAGTDVVFKVKVDMNYNRSAGVRYVFTPNGGEAVDFEKTVDGEYFVYTLAAANAADGVVTMIGEYVENTYEATISLDLYDWGVLETLDGVTVKIGDESVSIVDGKATASLTKGTYSVVITEPTTRTTTVSLEVNPTDWTEALTYVKQKTIEVGYSTFWADDATSGAIKTKYFTQSVDGTISSTSPSYDNNAAINLSDYTLDANGNFAVKVGFTYKGGVGDDPHFCIRLDNTSNYRFIFEVTKSYFRIAFGTPTSGLKSNLAQHDLGDAFKAGVNMSGNSYKESAKTNPFEFEWMIVKTEGKLSLYHTIGSVDGSFILFATVTTEGVKLANGEFAHTNGTETDIAFDTTVANAFTDCLKATGLKLQFYNLNVGSGNGDVDYTGYGVTTDSKKWEALIA